MIPNPKSYDCVGSAAGNQSRMHPTPHKGRALRRLRAGCGALAVSLSLLAGCGAVEEDDGAWEHEAASPDVAQQAAAGGERPVPAPQGVVIDDIKVAGSGCPDAASWDKWISSDKKVFSLAFFKYNLESPANVGPLQSSLFCDVTFRIKMPKGYAYRVTSITFAGRGDLPLGVPGKLDTKYQFVGTQAIPTATSHNISALGNAGWTTTQKLVTTPLGPSDCDVARDVVLNTRLTLTKRAQSSAGKVKLSSTSGEIEPTSAVPGIQLDLLYYRCPQS